MSKEKGKPRLCVQLDTETHRYPPVWLSRDEPSKRLDEAVAALDLSADDLTDEFKAMLLTGMSLAPKTMLHAHVHSHFDAQLMHDSCTKHARRPTLTLYF